jgi:hypothetical protein
MLREVGYPALLCLAAILVKDCAKLERKKYD